MIKANELRIGNWVSLEFVGPFQWDYSHFEDYIKDSKHGFNFQEAIISDKIEPIPLTPEILESCGFEKWKDKNVYKSENDLYILWNENAFEFYNGYYVNDDCYIRDIEYLHQLQNLYFALCDDELEVKLPVTDF